MPFKTNYKWQKLSSSWLKGKMYSQREECPVVSAPALCPVSPSLSSAFLSVPSFSSHWCPRSSIRWKEPSCPKVPPSKVPEPTTPAEGMRSPAQAHGWRWEWFWRRNGALCLDPRKGAANNTQLLPPQLCVKRTQTTGLAQALDCCHSIVSSRA